MLSARLFLVRHGQSTYNAQARLQGQADPPLSDAGRAEAERAAARRSPRFRAERVVTSDLDARERDRGAARLSRTRRRDAALARDRRRRVGRAGRWPTSRRDSEPAWRGGPLRRRPAASRGRSSQARVGGAVDELLAAGGDRGSWSATAASSARRSRTSPAPTRSASPGPPNASVTVVRGAAPPQLRGLRAGRRDLSVP